MSKWVNRALTSSFGAELAGINLREPQSDEDIAAIRAAWAEHKLLLFRNQTIDEAHLVRFSAALGSLEIHVRTEFLSPDHPEVLYISNIKRDGRNIGILSDSEVGWHYDQIYLPRPAVGSLLCAVELPASGGNTFFADMGAAYEALPDNIKDTLAGRSAVQSYETFNRAYSVPTNKQQKQRSPDIEHPVIRTHPITGKPALYICPGMTTRISGLEPSESDELLEFLFEWSVRPEFVYEHAWQPGDCLLWDNASTMHRREPFDPEEARLMKRTTILPPADLAVPF